MQKSEDGRISLTAQDFEDPEGDPLQYRCGYIAEDKKATAREISYWSESSTCEDLDLPPGMEFPSSGGGIAGGRAECRILRQRLFDSMFSKHFPL